MISRRLTTALFVIGIITFGALTGYGQLVQIPGAGGLYPFDIRPLGYSVPDVGIYLAMISDTARTAYLGPVRILDTIFPIVFTLWLLALATRKGVGMLAFIAAIAAIAYGVFDLMENAAIGALLRGPDVPDAALAAKANTLTLAKYSTLLVSVIAIALNWKRR